MSHKSSLRGPPANATLASPSPSERLVRYIRLLENYYLPGDFEAQNGRIVENVSLALSSANWVGFFASHNRLAEAANLDVDCPVFYVRGAVHPGSNTGNSGRDDFHARKLASCRRSIAGCWVGRRRRRRDTGCSCDARGGTLVDTLAR